MSRKAYKILTDIDLSRNKLLNVSNIEGPDVDDLSRDLKIHANKGDLRIETTSDGNKSGSKGSITLGIDKNKTSISIKPDATVDIQDNEVIVNGTDSLVLKSKENNSITLTSKNNTTIVDADIINVGSEKDPINTINEYVNTQALTNNNYTQIVNNELSLTTKDKSSITAEKTFKVTAGKPGKYGSVETEVAYLLSVEGVDKNENDDFINYQSIETVDNLNVRNSQTFSGSNFKVNASNEISLDAPTINIGQNKPENTSLHILSRKNDDNQFILNVGEKQSDASLKTLHVGENLELKDKLSFTNAENNLISFKKKATIETPNLTLKYPNPEANVLEMITTPSEEEGKDSTLTTTLKVDNATISTDLMSNAETTLNRGTKINGNLSINATTSISGDSLGINSTEINLGNLNNPELNIKAKTIVETSSSKTLTTTESYSHIAKGTYKVARAEDFEIEASKKEEKNESGEIVSTFDSHVKANTLTANNNVQIGSQNNGVNIYWDNSSKSLVFTKWE